MSADLVLLNRHGGSSVITLNRRHKLNALNAAMRAALAQGLAVIVEANREHPAR